jgi:hypothetical protein
MRFGTQTLIFLLTAATLLSALPVDKVILRYLCPTSRIHPVCKTVANINQRNDIQEREELYPAPDLGRIKVEDKREELYPAPDLGRIKVEDKREELYPAPDLGRIKVEDK